MTKTKSVLRDAAFVGIAFLGMQTFQSYLVKGALKEQDHLLAHRLGASVAGVINQAHKANDDLVVYQIVHALAQGPGMIQARIIPTEGGKETDVLPGAYTYSLRDGEQKWGTLGLWISDRFRRKILRRQFLAGMALSGFLWLLLFFYFQLLERRMTRLRHQNDELNGLVAIEKRKVAAAQESQRLSSLQTSAWLQIAFDHIRDPMLLLDGHQRVVLLNRVAASVFGSMEVHKEIGKSWQDFHGLRDCGASLAHSLEAPGQAIRSPVTGDRLIFDFITMMSDKSVVGTLVKIVNLIT